MKRMTQTLLYKGDHINRANVVWNIAGSFVYAFASMVLSFLVIRLAGEEQGGIFSFGFSTLGQQLFLVAYFGIRPFHITDGAGEYTFGDYREHRNITCLIALAAGAVFMMIRHGAYLRGVGDYNGEKCTILLLLVVYKVIDGYADVYESEFQRQGSLYLTGKSNFFRTILSVSVFTVILAAFENLLLACLAAVAAQIGGVILFNLDAIYRIQGKGTFVSVRKIEKKLTKLYTLRKRFEEKGVVHEVKTLQFEVISPSDDIREKLEIIENEDVYKLIRCFYADHIPYAIEISFVPTGPYPDLSANDIEKQGLYKSMQMYNIIPEHASENIFAVKLTNEDALILGLKPQDIAIQIERTTHSNNRIIEFTTSLIKTEYFYYTSELSST